MELKLNIEYNNLLELINQLPAHLREQLTTDLQNTPNKNDTNAKEKLATLIKEMRAKPMFAEIEDPVDLQKNLRNEWG